MLLMLFSYLFSVRKKLLSVILPFIIIPALSCGFSDNYSRSYQSFENTAVIDLYYSNQNSGTINQTENKTPSHLKIHTLLFPANQKHRLEGLACCISIFNNESVPDIRLMTFLTSQFSTST
jgi:hypothetical protein